MGVAGGILFPDGAELEKMLSDWKQSMSYSAFRPPSWNFRWTCTSGFTVIS